MILRIDFGQLKDFNETLYRLVSNKTGITSGVHEIEDAGLQPHTREMLRSFLAAMEEKAKEKNSNERAKKDAAAAQDRLLNYWVAEKGLIDNEANGALISDYVHENEYDYWTFDGVDRAVEALQSQLAWKKPAPALPSAAPAATPPAPAAPAQPVKPEPVKLKDGSDQLPLDTAPSYAHTKEQLRDLAQRQRAAQKTVRKDGFHGINF